MFGTFQLKFESAHWTPDKYLTIDNGLKNKNKIVWLVLSLYITLVFFLTTTVYEPHKHLPLGIDDIYLKG